ncbi:glycosyltransferase [Stagnimonas aquatica]|uniref:Glycosyltransferase n=1 Tax=Stagnimonas aquatica TaxID=2689987 RepID=A0A3N0VL12_9GAMM|nr:glycosyltransferase [Stagnimonas aquatica]ROH93400.1 glycosyltransferase [Stagnimonas aquatica]
MQCLFRGPEVGEPSALPVCRIALFLPSLAGGGAERAAINLAAGIAARGYSVDLVLARAEGAYLGQVHPSVRVVDLGASRPLTAVPALSRYLRAERPGALLSILTGANIAAQLAVRLARSSTRCVVCEQCTLSVDLANSSWSNRMVVLALLRYFYPRAHAVVAISHGVADDLARIIDLRRESISVVYNPIVSSDLARLSREAVSHRWLQGGGPPVIVGAGRLARQKDFGNLIRAFSQLRKRQTARLIILGEGEGRADLEQLCRVLGVADDVDLPGFVANPHAFFSRAALFALSSRWEGLANVVVEALAAGVPVVSTDCPSGPKEILDGGKYGQLVPVEDSNALAEAMSRVLTGNFVATNPEESVRLFDVETIVDRYLELLVGDRVGTIA